MTRLRLLAIVPVVALAAGCDGHSRARADSLQVVAAQQSRLSTQLSAQKDSLTRVIFDADAFISKIDSQIATVKGLPPQKRHKHMESPVAEQLVARKEMLARVDALVKRAKQTAVQLAEARKREQALRGENDQLKAQTAQLQQQLAQDQQMIEELGARIQRQTETIAALQGQVDSLTTEMRTADAARFRAYYIVGTEKELLEKGVVEREGGKRLLLVKVGRSLQPARTLKPELFTPIDQREMREIPLPDSTRRYRLVSRQSLDNAEVREREQATFRGPLKITNTDQFWAPSRYLILVER